MKLSLSRKGVTYMDDQVQDQPQTPVTDDGQVQTTTEASAEPVSAPMADTTPEEATTTEASAEPVSAPMADTTPEAPAEEAV